MTTYDSCGMPWSHMKKRAKTLHALIQETMTVLGVISIRSCDCQMLAWKICLEKNVTFVLKHREEGISCSEIVCFNCAPRRLLGEVFLAS